MDPAPQAHRVELLTRSGCHLCDAAKATVAEVAARFGVEWREVRIDGDQELVARHAEEVPVLLVDGVPRDFWVIDAGRLERLLGS